MRILIFSDLHANLAALAALNTAEQPPDALFFLGDAVGYGPDPAACVGWLRAYCKHAIRGDHDHAIVTDTDFNSPDEFLQLANATRDYTLRQLRAPDLQWLAAQPMTARIELGGAWFFLAHASPRKPLGRELDFATMSEDKLRAELDNVNADVVLVGHTHVPAIRRIGKMHVVNPGSLGQPRHGLPSATYAIWEDGHLQIKHIDYDPTPTQNKLPLMRLDAPVETRLREVLGKGM
jgi:putative phosphoesterase